MRSSRPMPPQGGHRRNQEGQRNFAKNNHVSVVMLVSTRGSNAPQWIVLAGGAFFIVVLAVSAFWEADIRWLHFFQAWMYIAAIILSFRGSRWGYFIGISAGGFWDYTNVFATTFLHNGLQQLWKWIYTGHLERPDLLIAIPAWLANFAVVVGCVWGYLRLRDKSWRDGWELLLTFMLTTGYLAVDMYLFQPRYLGIFPRLLHPHLR
jgi:hypothetical protein